MHKPLFAKEHYAVDFQIKANISSLEIKCIKRSHIHGQTKIRKMERKTTYVFMMVFVFRADPIQNIVFHWVSNWKVHFDKMNIVFSIQNAEEFNDFFNFNRRGLDVFKKVVKLIAKSKIILLKHTYFDHATAIFPIYNSTIITQYVLLYEDFSVLFNFILVFSSL